MFCNGKKKNNNNNSTGRKDRLREVLDHKSSKVWTIHFVWTKRQELRFGAVHTNSFSLVIKWSMITFIENALQAEACKSEVLNISVNSRKGDLWIQLTHINWIPIQSPGRVRINMADGTLGCLFIVFFIECILVLSNISELWTTAAWIRLVDTKSSSANNNIENFPGVPP